jgi:transcriptional antiterminator RfaH
VSFEKHPAVVDVAIIEAIQAKMHNGYVTIPAVHSHTPGEVVRITDGPLGGIEAIFERELSGYERAILLLNALSCQAKIVVDSGNIVNMQQVRMARSAHWF